MMIKQCFTVAIVWIFVSSVCSLAAADEKQLNNFVVELVRLENVSSGETVEFTNPHNGWILFAVNTKRDVAASFIDPEQHARETIVFVRPECGETTEAMKYLPPGRYSVRFTSSAGGSFEAVSIRSVPTIFYNAYRRFTRLHECNDVARDWKFIEKHVAPNVNTFVVHRANRKQQPSKFKPSEEVFDEWARRGKHWFDETPIDFKAKNVDEAYRHFVAEFDLANTRYNGYLVDEFCERPERKEMNRINIEALQRMADRPDCAGKLICPYIVTTCPKPSNYDDVWQFAVKNRFLVSQEWYLRNMRSDAGFPDRFAPDWHTDNMRRWEERTPGAADRLIMTLGGWNLPNCAGELDPQLDAKVFLDRQINFLANHPAYRGISGINVWTTSYMDEEFIRWMCRLYRHYCIDGNKEPLSKDPYVLPHLVNADFEQGTDGWTIQAAEADSVRAGKLKDYGIIQGRYAYRTNEGEHFLVARRSEKRPNVVSRTVRNLTPGRLYTFRMYTADYNDLTTGKSKRQKHAVSISFNGAEKISGREFHLPYSSSAALDYPPFDATKQPCWINYHWVLFRAVGETAELNVSDWLDPQQPGGAAGQELVFNYFKIEPYFED